MANAERDAQGHDEGRMRREFAKRVRLDAWERCGGKCENCTAKITATNGPPNYDHILPDALGGEPELSNCQVLCKTCHGGKTTDEDRPRIDKARRGFEKRIGARERRSKLRKPSGYIYDWSRGRYSRAGADDT